MSDTAIPAPAAAPPPARSKRRLLWSLLGIAALLAALFGVGHLFTKAEGFRAEVGDCVAQSGKNDITIVPCAEGEADFKVVGRVENQRETQAQFGACSDFKGAESVYWHGKPGETGLVLCLAKAGK